MSYAELQAERFRLVKEGSQLEDTDRQRAHRLYMRAGDVQHQAWLTGMEELYGLRSYRRGQACIFRVAGIHKHRHGPLADECFPTGYGPRESWRGSTFWDHVGFWTDEQGRLTVTTEPYHTPNELKPLANVICSEVLDGRVTYEVGAESPWYPGSTTLLIFRRA